ncbi:DUF4365 domain-containing protein [Mucilaginibacter sp.]|uniref:DUF4365 domain-containing protein n=1 Tax=Mucilaginibacter sp. TaxID=1882438 RepID=UPI002ED02F7E
MSKTNHTKPASFTSTTPSEERSADILQYCLDRNFIKGNIKTTDKYPNSDGLLTITDAQNMPLGMIDIQLKTLQTAHIKNPRYQCERSQFAYAEQNLLPFILIVADQINEVAYWLHLDDKTCQTYKEKGKGKTVMVPIPSTNLISKKNKNYISEWTQIIGDRIDRIQLYPQVQEQLKSLQLQLGKLGKYFQPAYSLEGQDIREIHQFLDHYNSMLDREFKAIKDILFYGCWKISIGIIEYKKASSRFILFPQSYYTNAPLIRELKKDDTIKPEDLFEDGISVIVSSNQTNSIKNEPKKTALNLLRGDIKKFIGKTNLAVDNAFLAHEYLASFINTFQAYLGISKEWDDLEIQRLHDLLFIIMPVVAEQTTNYAAGVQYDITNIDHFADMHEKPYFLQRISKAEESIEKKCVPNVYVSLTSVKFDFNLLIYFMDRLKISGINRIKKVYPGKYYIGGSGIMALKNLEKSILEESAELFFKHFKDAYGKMVDQHFPLLKDDLGLFAENDLLIFSLFKAGQQGHKPCLLFQRLKARGLADKKLLFFKNEFDSPILQAEIYEQKKRTLTYEGVTYDLQVNGTTPLDFLFTKTPTYTLLNEILKERIQSYITKEYTRI